MANLRRHYTEGMGKSADDVGSEGSYWERALESYAVRTAVQVEHIRLILGLKALGFHTFNQLKVHPLSKFWFSDVVNLHPYSSAAADLAG